MAITNLDDGIDRFFFIFYFHKEKKGKTFVVMIEGIEKQLVARLGQERTWL